MFCRAAEEAMKAFLAWHDAPFRKTHNLEELGQRWAAPDSRSSTLAS
jgi:hypothetical protein